MRPKHHPISVTYARSHASFFSFPKNSSKGFFSTIAKALAASLAASCGVFCRAPAGFTFVVGGSSTSRRRSRCCARSQRLVHSISHELKRKHHEIKARELTRGARVFEGALFYVI